jgi:hypothetical protein
MPKDFLPSTATVTLEPYSCVSDPVSSHAIPEVEMRKKKQCKNEVLAFAATKLHVDK